MDRFGFNLGYVDDLFQEYLRDPAAVSEVWREFFVDYHPGSVVAAGTAPAPGAPIRAVASRSSAPARAPEADSDAAPAGGENVRVTAEAGEAASAPTPGVAPTYEPLRGVAGKIVENMQASLTIPTATSVRTFPVKLLEENRRLINQHREASALPKVSFTHIIAYAITSALEHYRTVSSRFELRDGQPFRVLGPAIHLGLAIDVEKSDGSRSLLVPNLKNAGGLDFATFVDAYNGVVDRARRGRLTVDDFQGTSVTITNPGMIGTILSVPRLMVGQGAIIGVGSIGYPPEYAGMAEGAVARLGLSKIMTLTSTYDHRIIQGAESGAFLAHVERLLLGQEHFYERIFDDLEVTHEPIAWVGEHEPPLGGAAGDLERISKQARVLQLIHAYRVRGHLIANLDPLGSRPPSHPELEMSHYGLCVWDLDRQFMCGGLAGHEGTITLREILDILRDTYCRYIGVEYMHITSPVERNWLQRRMETDRNQEPMELAAKLRILEKLNAAEAFERFLHTTYVGHKRFSLEGCETLIPVLDELLECAGAASIEDVVIGMSHRGRLNVLTNIVGKRVSKIFAEFEDIDPSTVDGSGDVKYHLGAAGVHATRDGRTVRVEIASNPSHLESVDPVVEGMVRARQDRIGDTDHRRVLPILIHGDAAFAGQGVVFETLNLSQLRGYRTGGTIHIVANNQIGFTTGAADARSTHYCTDVAKAVGAPIFHVNGDHPQSAVRTIRVALAYRQQFGKDVVVDINCYRRWGHNEGDEPAYTQPVMYERIERKRSVRKLATERLLRRREIDGAMAERFLEDFQTKLEHGFAELQSVRDSHREVEPLPDLEETEGAARPRIATGVPRPHLERVLHALSEFPEGFAPHEKLARQLQQRSAQFQEDRISWALAESLAFGTLVLDGTRVRLSGQDSGRGTFSQRHAKVYDARTGSCFIALDQLVGEPGRFQVHDSSLSEFAVLGFEYGYSVEAPDTLVLWEAQFGDFANGAQVIIDQYLAAAEEKWGQRCRLTLLLPHGYEGQGPEHSSARLERFLQLCSEGNLRVVNPSTPAQYFHLLRRQVESSEHKPLIVMTPKSLLRHRACVSPVSELTTGSFCEVLDDTTCGAPNGVRRVLLASGKVYYDLLAARAERRIDDIAILRLEQFYPFPGAELSAILRRYANASEVLWVQEEPRNMGAWDFLDERLYERLLPGQVLHYVGRPWSASTATGSSKRHVAEQRRLIDTALTDSVLEAAAFQRQRIG
ncbi:MAG: multifunctional oxoglutarate decarboxylase/oxoglutarate dehydrogenase thiamine pyrophosphate-binding subunit/dihydrolipoyllysine-residue succinyltransferase subunit [Planctomycetota bacterium]